jgi:hypothetical protein
MIYNAKSIFCKFYANDGGKRPIQRQPLLVQYKHQANPILSINNTPLVISRSDKNKQLTLLRQLKLALTAKINFLRYKNIGAPKKFKKMPRLLIKPSSGNFCQKFGNLSHETVPFRITLLLPPPLPHCYAPIWCHLDVDTLRSGKAIGLENALAFFATFIVPQNLPTQCIYIKKGLMHVQYVFSYFISLSFVTNVIAPPPLHPPT